MSAYKPGVSVRLSRHRPSVPSKSNKSSKLLLFEEGTDNITQNFDLDVLFYCLHPLEEFLSWYRGYLGPTFLRSFPPNTYPATRARDTDSTTCDGTTTSHISVICISSRASSQSVSRAQDCTSLLPILKHSHVSESSAQFVSPTASPSEQPSIGKGWH